MDKAADAFRTISEVADELEVPKHVLRFWEIRFPQIKPMKRGGGRRYYRPADMELLRGIRHLLHNEGYTIKGVQKILREHGVEAVKNSLLRQGQAAAVVAADASGPKRRGLAPSGTARGRATRTSATPRERKGVIASMIRELEAAREILIGKPGSKASPGAKATPPAAARARARR